MKKRCEVKWLSEEQGLVMQGFNNLGKDKGVKIVGVKRKEVVSGQEHEFLIDTGIKKDITYIVNPTVSLLNYYKGRKVLFEISDNFLEDYPLEQYGYKSFELMRNEILKEYGYGVKYFKLAKDKGFEDIEGNVVIQGKLIGKVNRLGYIFGIGESIFLLPYGQSLVTYIRGVRESDFKRDFVKMVKCIVVARKFIYMIGVGSLIEVKDWSKLIKKLELLNIELCYYMRVSLGYILKTRIRKLTYLYLYLSKYVKSYLEYIDKLVVFLKNVEKENGSLKRLSCFSLPKSEEVMLLHMIKYIVTSEKLPFKLKILYFSIIKSHLQMQELNVVVDNFELDSKLVRARLLRLYKEPYILSVVSRFKLNNGLKNIQKYTGTIWYCNTRIKK